jgi:hypothetical protein
MGLIRPAMQWVLFGVEGEGVPSREGFTSTRHMPSSLRQGKLYLFCL